MNQRILYARALLSSLPIAADIVLNHPDQIDDDELRQTPLDDRIATLSHLIAFELSNHFAGQMSCWDQYDEHPDRELPQTTADRTVGKTGVSLN